jgi:outer membrane protein assembly factor BamB
MTVRASLLTVALAAGVAPAADPTWPQFRGPAGTGVADEAKPPVEIGPTKNVAWKVAVPSGLSSPVVAGDSLFLTGFENGKLYTLAYSRKDGKELWRAEAPAKQIEVYHKTESSPAASTVATDGERVVSYFGSCGLFCYDTAGKEQWRFEMPCNQTANDFGSGTSPILADGVVYLVRDVANDPKLMALDAKTGSLVWEKKRDGFPTGWGSPVLWDTPGGKELVVPGGFRLTSYDPKTGAEKWTVTGLAAVDCTTPVTADDGTLIYAAWSPGGSSEFKMPTFDELLKPSDKNGDGALTEDEVKGSFLADFFSNNDTNKDGKLTRDEWDAQQKFLSAGKNLAVAVKPGGKGDVTATNVLWKATKGLPYVPSPLIYRGQMYTVNMRGLVSAYEAKTGKEVFLEENVGLTGIYASPVAANGYVYLFGLDGTLVVLKAGDFPEVAARAKFGERVAATPAVAGDTMYVRTAKHLYAFGK